MMSAVSVGIAQVVNTLSRGRENVKSKVGLNQFISGDAFPLEWTREQGPCRPIVTSSNPISQEAIEVIQPSKRTEIQERQQ